MQLRSILIALTLSSFAAAPNVQAQIPVDASQATLITISDGHAELVRILATNDLKIGKWKAGTEYWYGAKDLGLLAAQPLVLTVEQLDAKSVSEEQLDALLADFSLSFSAPQVVGQQAWSVAGKPSDCAGKALFHAADPDKPSVRIGVLLEQDQQTGALVGSTLLKTFNTGRIFDVAPEQLKLSPAASCDPQDIAAGTWYQYSAGAK